MLLCVLTAAGFSWPLVARVAGTSPLATAFVVALVGPLVVATFIPQFEWGTVNMRSLIILIVAGIMGGIGIVAYSGLISGKWDISTYVPAALILMIVFLTIGGKLFYGEALSTTKIIGMVMAGTSVWLMTRPDQQLGS